MNPFQKIIAFCGGALILISCSSNADEIKRLMDSGNRKYDSTNYKDALAEFEKVLQLDAENNDALLWRGACKEELEDYDGAGKDYDLAIKNQPTNQGYYWRSTLKLILNDTAGALKDMEQSIALGPDCRVYFRRSMVNWEMGDTTRAIHDINEGIKLDPNDTTFNGDMYYERARFYYFINKEDAALADLNKSVDLMKAKKSLFHDDSLNLSKFYNHRALVNHYMGNEENALADYQNAIMFDRTSASAYFNFGIYMADTEDPGACSYLRVADSLGHESAAEALEDVCGKK